MYISSKAQFYPENYSKYSTTQKNTHKQQRPLNRCWERNANTYTERSIKQ